MLISLYLFQLSCLYHCVFSHPEEFASPQYSTCPISEEIHHLSPAIESSKMVTISLTKDQPQETTLTSSIPSLIDYYTPPEISETISSSSIANSDSSEPPSLPNNEPSPSLSASIKSSSLESSSTIQIAETKSESISSKVQSSSSSITPSPPVETPSKEIDSSQKRFNYASFDCGAQIQASSPGSKSATSVLVEDKDKYMISQCSSEIFLVLELCDTIQMDSIHLANYEYYSSVFHKVNILGNDRYPPKAESPWKKVAELDAKNTRNVQKFNISTKFWFKYIRIEFETHYGTEYFCPVSLVRIFGTTMMQDLHQNTPSEDTDSKTNPTQQPNNDPGQKMLSKLSDSFHPFQDIDMAPFRASPWFKEIPTSFKKESLSSLWKHVANPSNSESLKQEEIPTSQENIFKAFMKRINKLERNSTLYFKFLNDQTTLLEDSLSSIDKDTNSKLMALHIAWNSTVNNLMRDLEDIEEQFFQFRIMENSYKTAMTRSVESLKQDIKALQDSLIKRFNAIIIIIALLIVPFLFNFLDGRNPFIGARREEVELNELSSLSLGSMDTLSKKKKKRKRPGFVGLSPLRFPSSSIVLDDHDEQNSTFLFGA